MLDSVLEIAAESCVIDEFLAVADATVAPNYGVCHLFVELVFVAL